MFALTRQEKLIIVCVMLSLVLGAGIKQWRDSRRTSSPQTAQSPGR